MAALGATRVVDRRAAATMVVGWQEARVAAVLVAQREQLRLLLWLG